MKNSSIFNIPDLDGGLCVYSSDGLSSVCLNTLSEILFLWFQASIVRPCDQSY
jgi:hypothetical protein